ncbi:acyl-CoA dehydrogenase [Spongisporangium articulatum]|uniref:Acyl-CoA dehydrogenase n=1 Tax=Spongisporangium articulatum TaxID=3362603 RepID=A0ABW8AIL2_9ACTN
MDGAGSTATSGPDAATVQALTDLLDGRWAWVRQRSRTEGVGLLAPMEPGLPRDEYRARVTARVAELAEMGYPAMGFPKDVGGGGELGGSVTAFEMIGYGDLSLMVKAGVQWGLFGGALAALGTERHHAAYLADVMSGKLPGCFAMTETGHGSDVQSLGTHATYDPGTQEFVVRTTTPSARKDYIGNAARDGRLAVVFAQLVTASPGETPVSHGVHAFVVPLRAEDGTVLPGVEIEDDGLKAGLNGVDNGRISFDDVRIPRGNLLDRYASVAEDGTYSSPIENPSRRFFTMLGTLVRGRISVGGAAGSAAKEALTIAVRYGDTRRQFEAPAYEDRPKAEVPVLDYLAHQRRLLPLLAKSYALHFAQGELVEEMHELQKDGPIEEKNERRQRELETRAAGLKAISTWHTTLSIQTAREACGGAGYLAENRLPQLKADTDVFTTFEGDNTVLLQLVAKNLLTQYADHVGDLDTLGMVRFLTETVVDTVIERTAARTVRDRLAAAVPGRDDEEELLDRTWQLAVFADREEHVLEGAARRLRRALKGDAFAVFNEAQDHVLKVARVHVDRLLLEAFSRAIERCENPAAKALLDGLCDLFVLTTIEADRAWFMEHNRLTPARSRAVIKAVDVLCGRLRPAAVGLVDAFAIPDEWLDAAILR